MNNNITKVAIINEGCIREYSYQKNFERVLKSNGIYRATKFNEADYLLYITCAGTGQIIYNEVATLSKYISLVEHYNKKIIIVGCLADEKALFKDVCDLDSVVLIDNKEWIIPVINYINKEHKRNSINTKISNVTRYCFDELIRIQFFMEKGCTNNCSFCKSNYMDLNVSSIPYDKAMYHLKNLISKGTKEILLSGENLTLYGIDLYGKRVLHKFIHELSIESNLERIVLHELTPQNMYDELIEEIVTNKKIAHISMQLESASDKILKLMNRNHTLDEYDKIIKPIIDSGKYVSTILMSGFPEESYDDLDITIDYIKKRGIIASVICEYDNFNLISSSKLIQLSNNEKRRHTMYLKKAKDEIVDDIRRKYITNTNKYILIGKDYKNRFVFSNDLEDIYATSTDQEFSNLELGSIINTKAKKLVKANRYNSEDRIILK